MLAQIVFWLSIAMLFYTYLGYPILIYALSLLRPIKLKTAPFEPKVSVIITAYNEENDLRAKLENTLQLDYCKEKLEILVASDGSTDRTDDIAREFEPRGVKLFRQEGRVGKTITQNNAVEKASGEIILFSDATTMYQHDVLQVMLPNFSDPGIGCVAGKLVYVDPTNSSVGEGAKSYWEYETFIKTCESKICSLIGASGCLYALRKSAYVPMYAEACSDFLIVTKIYQQGLRTIYEPNAICTEETNAKTDKELKMRVRVIAQTYTDLWRHRKMLNPLRSGFYAIELISHKVLRYAIPLFLILCFVSAGFASVFSPLYAIVFALQALFYLTAFVSWIMEKTFVQIKILALPQYFVIANLASILAFVRFLRGERIATWEPIRAANQPQERINPTIKQVKESR